jgi:aminoglycoside phosphotransferase (APT) family kinase protein
VTVATRTLRRAAQRPSAAWSSGERRVRLRNRLARARAVVPRILATESRSLPRCAREAVVVGAELTSTDMAVVVLAPVDESPCLVIKLPLTAEAARGLERETGVLAALHDDERLGAWRDLVPHPCASGRVERQCYRVDLALTGRPALDRAKDPAARGRMLEQAAETIQVVHRATATTVPGDLALTKRWIDAHLGELLHHGRPSRSLASRFERLRHELHDALAGHTFSAGWIHGDYWLGNILFSGEVSRPDGIVDWDAAGPVELPMHDLLHLVLYTRRLVTGQDLGQIVTGQLSGGSWSQEERRLLEDHGAWCHDGSLSERHALLLYWLRHAALHARQQEPPVGYRYRLWERRNVHPVLAAL